MKEDKKGIDDLRATLFATLQGIKDGSVALDQARAINEIGKTIIDTAKVEVDYLRVAGGGESEFLQSTVGQNNLPPGITSVFQNRLEG